ncbi:MAG: glycosyltransferase [Pseudomonadota bacterium]
MTSNIAFYLPNLDGGGAERIFCLLANEFADRGYNCSIIVDNKDGPNLEYVAKSVNIFSLGTSNKIKSLFGLSRILKDNLIDFVISGVGISNIKACLASFLSCEKHQVFITYHNVYSKDFGLGSGLTYKLASVLTRLSKKTICVSKDIKNNLDTQFRAHNKKTVVISNPIDIENIQEKSDNYGAHDDEILNTSYPLIVGAGRLVAQKNFNLLINAFALVREKKECKLAILGEGHLRQDLQNEINQLGLENDAFLLGYKDNPFAYLKKASLFAMSSHYEGFGNVIIEALSLGTPVVSTNCPGGPKDILDNGTYGHLVDLNDQKAFADAILKSLNSPIPATILKQRANEYSVAKIANQYEVLLNS